MLFMTSIFHSNFRLEHHLTDVLSHRKNVMLVFFKMASTEGLCIIRSPDVAWGILPPKPFKWWNAYNNDLNAPKLAERHTHRRAFTWQAYDRWAGLLEDFVARCAAIMPPVHPEAKAYDEDGPVFLEIDSDD